MAEFKPQSSSPFYEVSDNEEKAFFENQRPLQAKGTANFEFTYGSPFTKVFPY